MKLTNLLLSILILLIFCSWNQENKYKFFLPAEWETQSGVIVGGLDDNATFELATQLSKETQVYSIVIDSLKEKYIKKLSDAGANTDSIHLIASSTDFNYAERDGMLFMKNENGQKQLVNFAWNCYGWYFEPVYRNYIEKDKQSRELYTKLYINTFKHPVIHHQWLMKEELLKQMAKEPSYR
ncbi:MAG: hypothetical protein IPJ45_14515 [Ignavibacteria bacterium]|nr:hypothetical protein [Ignavibacteria bacterium]